MINQFRFEEDLIEANLSVTPDGNEVVIGENRYMVSMISRGKFRVETNGITKVVCCITEKNKAYIDIEGLLIDLAIPSDDESGASFSAGSSLAKDKIFAPMPGKIVKLLVTEGDKVDAKQPMVIVEAMKMENQVNSPAAGVVKKINFKDGEQVGTEIPIIELEI